MIFTSSRLLTLQILHTKNLIKIGFVVLEEKMFNLPDYERRTTHVAQRRTPTHSNRSIEWLRWYRTTGPWAASFTRETNSNQYLSKAMIITFQSLGHEKNNYLLFEKRMVLICNTMISLLTRMLCIKLKLTKWFWRIFILIYSICFRYFVMISPWKRTRSFICTNVNPLHPRILCAKICWNCSLCFGEEDENVKRTDWRTDRRQTSRKAHHLCFQLMWAKKLYITKTNYLEETISSVHTKWRLVLCSSAYPKELNNNNAL